eukprot:4632300-Pleurochrysis_carterae.AAC.4
MYAPPVESQPLRLVVAKCDASYPRVRAHSTLDAHRHACGSSDATNFSLNLRGSGTHCAISAPITFTRTSLQSFGEGPLCLEEWGVTSDDDSEEASRPSACLVRYVRFDYVPSLVRESARFWWPYLPMRPEHLDCMLTSDESARSSSTAHHTSAGLFPLSSSTRPYHRRTTPSAVGGDKPRRRRRRRRQQARLHRRPAVRCYFALEVDLLQL